MVERVPFYQVASWYRGASAHAFGAYSRDRCCVCFKPVGAAPALLRLARDDGGDWYAIPARPVAADEQTFGHFTLPIGPDCLRKRPELLPYLASEHIS